MASTRRTYNTQQIYFDQLQANDRRIQQLERGLNADRLIVSNGTSDERVRFKRDAKAWAMENKERQAAIAHQDTIRRRAEHIRKNMQTESLAKALREMEDDKNRAAGYRLKIEEEPELRELRRQLEAARVSKGLKTQMGHKEEVLKTVTQTRRLEGIESQQLELEQQEKEAETARQAMEEKALYAKQLEGQLTEKELARLAELEIKREEAAQIDRIIMLIEQEEEHAMVQAEAKKAQLRSEEDRFIQERDGLRYQRMQAEREESERVRAEAEKLEQRQSNNKAEFTQRQANLELLQTQMAETIRQKKESAEEIERLRQELYEEEYKEMLYMEEDAQQQKLANQRAEMISHHQQHMQFVEQARQQMEQEDREFQAAMMEKFARDDRLEQMSAQKRRMKSLAHGRDVQLMMEERKARQLHETQQKLNEHRELIAMEEARRDQIEVERRRILAEFAAADDMAGHLPKGVIREDDIDLLGPTMRGAYTHRPGSEEDFF
eukprot:m.14913 g.14913  ORF g.14913 m.14913 type:complete len:494 (-) comp10351_c0_seq1:72-1553(-)